MNKTYWIIIPILAIALTACSGTTAPTAIPTVVLNSGASDSGSPAPASTGGVVASAEVRPVDSVDLSFPLLGTVKAVDVEVGDTVTVYSGDKKYEYVVELKTIIKEKGEPPEVRRRNAQWIAPTDDERLTFVTCWPYTNNTHRVIVVAKPL